MNLNINRNSIGALDFENKLIHNNLKATGRNSKVNIVNLF